MTCAFYSVYRLEGECEISDAFHQALASGNIRRLNALRQNFPNIPARVIKNIRHYPLQSLVYLQEIGIRESVAYIIARGGKDIPKANIPLKFPIGAIAINPELCFQALITVHKFGEYNRKNNEYHFAMSIIFPSNSGKIFQQRLNCEDIRPELYINPSLREFYPEIYKYLESRHTMLPANSVYLNPVWVAYYKLLNCNLEDVESVPIREVRWREFFMEHPADPNIITFLYNRKVIGANLYAELVNNIGYTIGLELLKLDNFSFAKFPFGPLTRAWARVNGFLPDIEYPHP